ncbi:MAG TPA: amylo-alpha-1,6-glucosidase [Methanothrix sp.]|nr:amylo-alpha-1,6-glucosidase [Methanothrix sp.]HPJ83963.1 amylo-alpha-1,6-glucosidase [Methanothrix sp.]HPR66494.1 amylo-alpha-1,6-glucosidase [Methanothrix sp.]
MSLDLSFHPKSYQEGTEHEWLTTNGLGGYASSTILGANTRSYHGLLVAALSPPTGRTLLLSSLDEELISESGRYNLACHQYPGTIYPQGFRHLEEFRQDPVPTFLYRTDDGTVVEKKVFMVAGENSTVIRYEVDGSGLFKVVPLVNCRSFHVASRSPPMDQERIEGGGSGVRLRSGCDFVLVSDKARYVREGLWYNNLEYEVERQRGLAWREDSFSPGRFEVQVDGHLTFSIVASADRDSPEGTEELLSREEERIRNLVGNKRRDPRFRLLAARADQFLVRRGEGRSIIAGYYWFNDWGRDAMISLPGLLLTTRRFDDARAVLTTFAGAMKDGLLPNDFGAEGYNTIDAALWFFWSVYKYWAYSGDADLVKDLFPSLRAIVDRYSRETPGSFSDEDGLIISKPGLTWMDAKVGGEFVTPRAGKACEINALWYNALKVMEVFAQELGEDWDGGLAENVRESYEKFWNSEYGCLFDLIDETDSAIRPNQVIAASLPFTPLDEDQIGEIVATAAEELLTPRGLRTLSPEDPDYIGRYEGGPAERDRAYHQGTVWPWLIGPYITARLKGCCGSKKSRDEARELLKPLMDFDGQIGVGTICEVFDGDEPHRPGGCISQAWSVGEVMRAWSEDVMMGSNRLKRRGA